MLAPVAEASYRETTRNGQENPFAVFPDETHGPPGGESTPNRHPCWRATFAVSLARTAHAAPCPLEGNGS